MKRLFLLTIALFAIAGGTFWYLDQQAHQSIAVSGGATLSQNVQALQAAAKVGNAQAQYELAQRFETGEGVPKNLKQAFNWYKKSAEQGLSEARFKMGWMFANGSGTRQDYFTAAKWYRVAATLSNHPESQFRLGELYFNGRGVAQDYGKAIDFYTKAATKGHAASQYLLGAMFMEGWGVARDYIRAYVWLKQAAPHADQAMAVHKQYDPELKLALLIKKMNNFQISKAEKQLANLKTKR